jgi:GTP-binding protein HflX
MKSTVYREKALLVGAVLDGGRDADPPGAAGSDLPSSRSGPPDGPGHPRHDPFEELERLVLTAGAEILGKVLQRREHPDPATYVGSGKVREIAQQAEALGCDLVIFDNELSSGQVRNLEKALEKKVIDRTEVILDIFATHARSNQAKLQVELAQLEYALPRLRNLWTHFGQMVAGHGGLGGGIGTRGPGEQQLEVDRRLARQRITDLKREIVRIEARKRREVSARAANYTVALVGYTNAGKSTLLNALTGSDVLVEDKLFSTLDTKTRVWRLPNRQRVLLSDTVGFIRDLPHHLVASFHATLEEAREADLQLHVVDASHPEAAGQIAAVRSVLDALGCAGKTAIGVLNKADRVEDALSLRVLERAFPESVACSAKTGQGLDALAAAVERAIAGRFVEMDLEIPAGDGKTIAALARYGQILSREYGVGTARIRARVSVREVKKFERFKAVVAAGGKKAAPEGAERPRRSRR